MLEQNLLDNTSQPKLRKPLHSVLEVVLLTGHVALVFHCLYRYLTGLLAQDVLFLPLTCIAISYIYVWHRFSVRYDSNSNKAIEVPVYLNPLKGLSFFAAVMFFFISFFFVKYEDYRFDISLETAQIMTLFFAILGTLQFIYTLLSRNQIPKVKEKKP